ncbi:hypothetical protein [Devosia sp.]|uniref:hypothetical protein n=1 Tax=Devosia sp. TaxID=1871048 RepID=UPI001AD2351B|nr:hypothetical protein [Devosia sp.]MBN9334911.1 hypothetical protein [Devosia sp.]
MRDYPFGSRHPIDMMNAARGQIFIIGALTNEVERCSENRFKGGSQEEAAYLILEANAKVVALLEEMERAIDFLRVADDERTAA